MNAAPSTPAFPETLSRALETLARYDRGSDRGALWPLDEAVASAPREPALRAELEAGLVRCLRSPAATVAKEYACEKLAMIGGPASVEALAASLADPDLSHAATHALRAIPGAEAALALRRRLKTLAGRPLVGVITALGGRRDVASTEALAGLLSHADARVVAAAVWALGEMGTPAAARTLRQFLPGAPTALLPELADACLVCATRLRAARAARAARTLLDALLHADPPPHARAAALRLLASLNS